jgi:8-oxo-dGTP pyrophosphatase MutT (NUDIX family)
MPMSPYMRGLRELVGTRLVLIPAVAAIVRDDRGRVLLVKTTHGRWTLPAGAVDPGESPREAVVRETREEAGLEVRPVRLVEALGGPDLRVTYANGDVIEATVCVFDCEVTGGELACDGVETTEARWAEPEEAAAALAPAYPAALFARP